MTRTQQTLSLPPFTPAVTWLIAINAVVYFAMALASLSSPVFAGYVFRWFGLVPSAVMHGWVWQIVTYSVVHGGFIHWFFNMITLWMFGPSTESLRGHRWFLELFLAGVLGGALFSIGLAYSGILGNPNSITVGASAGIYAVLMAFAMFFPESEIIMIPLPVGIKAKYLIAILIVVTVLFSMQESSGVAHIAHLGGLVFGYLFVKFVPRRGMSFAVSERSFSLRNAYHRWKRKRAAKKFQVYMSKQERDPKRFYPEDPDKDKKDGDSGGWVN